MSIILDTGALIGYERGNAIVRAYLVTAAADKSNLRTSTAVVAQAWRDGARQAPLVRLLRGVEEISLSSSRARAIGELLRSARMRDVVDATLIELANDGDEILTSDPADLIQLANHSGKALKITPV